MTDASGNAWERLIAGAMNGPLVILSLIVIVGAGLVALAITPREEEPQIIVPLADVLVSAPGLTARQVERQVGTPLEKLLSQIDGVDLDPQALASRRIIPLDVAAAIEAANVQISAGEVRQRDRSIAVEAGAFIGDAEALGGLVVTVADGAPAVGTLQPRHETQVAARILGTALSVTIREGQRVAAGDVLIELDRRELTARLAPGDPLEVRIDALDRALPATVDEMVPAADPASRSFLVKATVPSRPEPFPGMFGRLLIPAGTVEHVSVPASAVRRVGQLEYVLVASDTGALRRYIRTGVARHDGRIEVLSGLRPGERVVLSPQQEGATAPNTDARRINDLLEVDVSTSGARQASTVRNSSLLMNQDRRHGGA